MASITYNLARQKILDGTLVLASDTLKVMLCTSAYTPDPDETALTTAASHELSGTGYTGAYGGSGRKTIVRATPPFGVNNTTDKGYMDINDLVWSAINAGTIAWAVLVKEITSDALSLPIAAITISPAIVTNGGDWTLQIDAAGLLTLA